MTLAERIQQLRKDNNLTQAKLAEKIELSVPQLVRYETKGVQPPADVLSKMAKVFGVSIDYLVNGTIQNKAEEVIDDNLLLKQFKAVEQMKKEDKTVISKLIDAFIQFWLISSEEVNYENKILGCLSLIKKIYRII